MTCPSAALWTEPSFARFAFYKLLTLIPVSAALIAIARYSGSVVWPLLYVGLCFTHAGIMYAAKCPHCAYYKMGGSTHRCFIWWGAPKLFAPRSGPEHRAVGIYAPLGMLVLTAFPLFWLWREWELLLLYLLGIAVLVMSIGLNECTRCLNFKCSHNGVPTEIRRQYESSRS